MAPKYLWCSVVLSGLVGRRHLGGAMNHIKALKLHLYFKIKGNISLKALKFMYLKFTTDVQCR